MTVEASPRSFVWPIERNRIESGRNWTMAERIRRPSYTCTHIPHRRHNAVRRKVGRSNANRPTLVRHEADDQVSSGAERMADDVAAAALPAAPCSADPISDDSDDAATAPGCSQSPDSIDTWPWSSQVTADEVSDVQSGPSVKNRLPTISVVAERSESLELSDELFPLPSEAHRLSVYSSCSPPSSASQR